MQKTSSRRQSKVRIKEAGPNLFAEFGIPDATEKNTKVQLAAAINQLIRRKELRQQEAARIMGCNQPDVSALSNYNLKIFSIERLIDFLLALDNDVEITIKPRNGTKQKPKTTVRVSAA